MPRLLLQAPDASPPTPRTKGIVAARLGGVGRVPPASTWTEITLAVCSLTQLRTLTVAQPWLEHRSRRWRVLVGGPARSDLVRDLPVTKMDQLQRETWRRLSDPLGPSQELSMQVAAPLTLGSWLRAVGVTPASMETRPALTWAHLFDLSGPDLAAAQDLLGSASVSIPPGIPDVVGLGSAAEGQGTLRRRAGRVVVEGDRIGAVRLSTEGLSEQTARQLRGARILLDDPTVHDGPVHHADFLIRCALAGIPVRTSGLAGVVRRLLGEELASALEATADADLLDDLVRERYCLRLAAVALRTHRGRSLERFARDGVRVLTEVHSAEDARRVCASVARQTVPVHAVTLLEPQDGELSDLPLSELAGCPVSVVGATEAGLEAALVGAPERYALSTTATTHHDHLTLQHLAVGLLSTGAAVVTSTPELAYLPALDATVRQARSTWEPGSTGQADSMLTSTEVLRQLLGSRTGYRVADLVEAAQASELTMLDGPALSGLRVLGAADCPLGDLDRLLRGSTWWSDGFAARHPIVDHEPGSGTERLWPQGVPGGLTRQHRIYDASRQRSRSYWRSPASTPASPAADERPG